MFGAISESLRNLRGQGDGKTAAIVQFEGVHEEVVPSLARALQAQGITPTVYLNENILKRRGDIFEHLVPGAFKYHYVPLEGRANWLRLKARLLARKSDAFVCLNTFQRDGAASFARDLKRPVIGIVHNPELFLQSEECTSLADRGDVGLLTLADHASSYLIAKRPGLAERVSTLVPVYFGDDLASPDLTADRHRMIVPGAINFKNRSYDFLFDAFAQAPKLSSQLEVRLLGGGPDRTALQERVTEANLADAITFSPADPGTDFVGHETYFRDLRTAAFILPLLPPKRHDYRVYKITAALSTAQGFCIPPLLDRWTALVYRVPCLATRENNPADAMKAAAAMDPEAYGALQDTLRARRHMLLEQNDAEMNHLLLRTGIILGIPDA